MQRAGTRNVIDVFALAAQEAQVFQTLDRAADEGIDRPHGAERDEFCKPAQDQLPCGQLDKLRQYFSTSRKIMSYNSSSFAR